MKKFILKKIFDIRPLTKRGELDFRIILKGGRTIRLKYKPYKASPLRKKKKLQTTSLNYPAWERKPWERTEQGKDWAYESLRQELLRQLEEIEFNETLLKRFFGPPRNLPLLEQEEKKKSSKPKFKIIAAPRISLGPVLDLRQLFSDSLSWKAVKYFAIAAFLVGLIIPGIAFVHKGFFTKDFVITSTEKAYQELVSAQESLGNFGVGQAQKNFQNAYQRFTEASKAVDGLGGSLLRIVDFLPFRYKISAGKRLLSIGQHISQAGLSLSKALSLLTSLSVDQMLKPIKEGEVVVANEQPLEILEGFRAELTSAQKELQEALKKLKKVKIEQIPDQYQKNFQELQVKLPALAKGIQELDKYFDLLIQLLGGSDIRHYLLLFQNNGELRATGGFIGSYALVTVRHGHIDSLLVDDIYNIDGQLNVNIIPPYPIQKISSGWSTHDANWFFDFPTSAQKIAWFYEKTGGPTVDGVITITPDVIEDLLKLTGPIPLPEYNLTVTADNFRDEVQYQVEEKYDKALGQPKKVLVDLAPRLLERITYLGQQQWKDLVRALEKALLRKDILIWFRDKEEEEFIQEMGWGGEMTESLQDYLAIVHSNINGYKTDRVIREDISQEIQISPDGKVYSTVTVQRRHFGQNASYAWYKKVNADYIRVYVPQGSRLISASGNTKEIVKPPLDYEKEGFQKDSLVSQIESQMTRDEKTGLDIFQENGKTVFGGWLYVSPGEEVVFKLTYQLPFIISPHEKNNTYSLVVQRQPGMSPQAFRLQINYPETWRLHWIYPKDKLVSQSPLRFKDEIDQDKIFGAVFSN